MVWEDQGLYFTLIFNGIVLTVGLIAAAMIHKQAGNHRILRPNRPRSTTAPFFESMGCLFKISDEETLQAVGVQPFFYVFGVKLMAFMFLSLFVACIVICSVSATDDYLNTFNLSNDPQECRGKSSGDCSDDPFCESFTVLNTTSCGPKLREGLFDLSVQNLTPDFAKAWRFYLVGVASAIGAIVTMIIVKRFAQEAASVIRRSYGSKVFAGLPCGGLGSVGARTVLVSGLPAKSKVLVSPAVFLQFLRSTAEERGELVKEEVEEEEGGMKAAVAADESAKKEQKEDEDKKLDTSVGPTDAEPIADHSQKNSTPTTPTKKTGFEKTAVAAKKEKEEVKLEKLPDAADLNAPSCELAQRTDANSIAVLRVPPEEMIDLMAEEKEKLTELTDAVAAWQQEEDESKKGKALEEVEKQKKELGEIREKLAEKVAEVPAQDMTGAAIVTFDRASTAFAFVRNYSAEQGTTGQSTAEIIGHRDGIVWTNLAITKAVAMVRTLIMVLVFTALVFFWSIPVGFLGSLTNIATLPGIGGPFAWLVSNIHPTILGILTAYLPTIVITVFNILLPVIFRFFSRLGGLKTVEQETRSVILMCAVFSIMSGIVMQAALQGGLSQLSGLITNPNTETVIALIIAIVSPQGGYWFAFLISAACLGNVLKLLVLGPLITSKIFVKLASRQEAYDRIFAPRETDYAFLIGRHVFFFAIAMLFHGTVPFLIPFGFLYCALAYTIERSVLIDGGAPDTRTVLNFAYVKTLFHTTLVLNLIAVIGTTLVCSLKESIGGAVLAAVAIVCNVATHYFVHTALAPVVFPTPETVLEIEADLEGQEVASDNAFVPEYATYAIDEEAVPRIEAETYAAPDPIWYELEQQEGSGLANA